MYFSFFTNQNVFLPKVKLIKFDEKSLNRNNNLIKFKEYIPIGKFLILNFAFFTGEIWL